MAYLAAFIIVYYTVSILVVNGQNIYSSESDEVTSRNFLFASLNELAMRIYNKPDEDRFVAIGLKTFGGWGNLAGNLMMTVGLGLATERVTVWNHAMVNEFFLHPLIEKGISFNRTSSQSIKSIQLLSERSNKYSYLNPCGQVSKHPLSTWSNDIYVSNCYGNNLMHPEILPVLKQLLRIPESVTSNAAFTIFSDLSHWAFSNPTIIFKQLVDEHVKNTTNMCQLRANEKYSIDINNPIEINEIDLVIQFRSWKDLNRNSFQENDASSGLTGEQCFHKCLKESLHMLELYIKNNKNESTTNHDVHCIYVTSDNDEVAHEIVETIDQITTMRTVSVHHERNFKHSHSMHYTNGYQDYFPTDLLYESYDMIDWMMLSQVNMALYSLASTFSTTARYRRGSLAQTFDIGKKYII